MSSEDLEKHKKIKGVQGQRVVVSAGRSGGPATELRPSAEERRVLVMVTSRMQKSNLIRELQLRVQKHRLGKKHARPGKNTERDDSIETALSIRRSRRARRKEKGTEAAVERLFSAVASSRFGFQQLPPVALLPRGGGGVGGGVKRSQRSNSPRGILSSVFPQRNQEVTHFQRGG